MRVVVTGGSGFIGSHVVDHLVDAGHDVTVIDLAPPRRPDVTHHVVDIADLEGLVRATAGADAVFHLAAFADVNDVTADPVGATDANVVGTARVWEACRRNGVKRAVLASTVWVYSAASDTEVLTESATFDLERAGHLYTSSKIAAELVVQSYHTLFGQEFTILRYGIPYGPRMRPSLVIPKFVTMALADEPITIQGDGSQHRNYVYIADLADAHVRCLDDAGANTVFNLEGSERVTIRHLVDCIGEALGIEPNVCYVDARSGDYAGAPISAQRASDALGWDPLVPFSEGLRRYVEWHLDEVSPVATAARAPAVRAPARALVATSDGVRPNALAGVAAAVVLVPAIVALAGMVDGGPAASELGILASGIALLTMTTLRRKVTSRLPASLALGLCLSAMWLLPQTGWSPLLLPIGALLGIGVHSITDGSPLGDRRSLQMAATAGVVLVGGAVTGGSIVFWLGAVMTTIVAFDAIARGLPTLRATSPRTVGASAGVGVAALLVAGMVGATSASASWFGPVVEHGPRSGAQVAVTFEGVSDPALATRLVRTLDRGHAKGTFFIGPASAGETTVGRQVFVAGELVAARGPATSLRHIDRGLGICPSYYRPARGWHSPVLWQQARARGVKLITWGVRLNEEGSATAEELAATVERQTQAGSIVAFDFSQQDRHQQAQMEAALPIVLRDLAQRRLVATRLDDLLGGQPYAGRCT